MAVWRSEQGAIIAAMDAELAPLVKNWTRANAFGEVHQWQRMSSLIPMRFESMCWYAACDGIGRDAAIRAFAAVEKRGELCAAISIGWAGALSAAAVPGTVLPVSWVVDAQTGERFELATTAGVGLVTAVRVAGVAEKARLAAAYPGAQLVDMEAATIARLAETRGIPAYCFKGVSDGFTDRLPDLNPFIGSRGQFHTVRFAASVALRPWYWQGLRRFGANSKKSAQELSEVVTKFLESQAYLRDFR